MTTITFDTHEFVKRLKEAGFTEPQAEVITSLQLAASSASIEQARQDYHLDELATRRDLKEVEVQLGARVRESELKLETKIAETRADLIRWVVGAGVLQTAIITALMLRVANHL